MQNAATADLSAPTRVVMSDKFCLTTDLSGSNFYFTGFHGSFILSDMRILLAGILGGIVMFIWTSIAHMVRSLGEAGIAEIPNAQQRAIWFRSIRDRLENLANVRVDLHVHVCHQI